MNECFKIRRASDSDVELISRCVDTAYQHYIDRIGKPPGPMQQDYAQAIQDHEVHVAIKQSEAEQVVQGVLVLKTTLQQFLLDNVAIHPAAQGRGLGKRLIDLAEHRAQQLGYDRVALYTHEQMHENLKMYPRLGYIETHRVIEHGFGRIYFEKVII